MSKHDDMVEKKSPEELELLKYPARVAMIMQIRQWARWAVAKALAESAAAARLDSEAV